MYQNRQCQLRKQLMHWWMRRNRWNIVSNIVHSPTAMGQDSRREKCMHEMYIAWTHLFVHLNDSNKFRENLNISNLCAALSFLNESIELTFKFISFNWWNVIWFYWWNVILTDEHSKRWPLLYRISRCSVLNKKRILFNIHSTPLL